MRSMNVAEKLKAKQAELEIETLTEMAELLGISKGMLSLLYSGKREPGGKVYAAVLALWPDIFSDDGGDDGDRKGDEHHRDGGDRAPVPVGDLRLPGFGVPGELDD